MIRAPHIRALLPLLSITALLACSDKSDGDSGDTTSGGATTSSSGGTSGTTRTANLSGTTLWADGSPAHGAVMQLCYTTCKPADVAEDGSWAYTGVEEVTHTLQALVRGDNTLATAATTVTLGHMEDRALTAPITMYDFATYEDFGAASTYELDGGLSVDIDPSTRYAGLYATTDGTTLASLAVSPAAGGLPLDDVSGQVVGQWYLGDFDYRTDTPWSFEVQAPLSVTPGAVLDIMQLDSEHHTWTSGGTATVGKDGSIRSDPGSGITILSTLVLSAP